MGRAWKAWRATIVAVASVIAIGSLASASPSLRAPRGPSEFSTGSTGTTAVTEPPGASGSQVEPAQDDGSDPTEASPGGADFSACEGMTGLDNAICRHEALLVVHPDNKGLQNSLGRLQQNKAKHEGAGGQGDQGVVPPDDDSSSSTTTSSTHGQSGESHGNAGGSGNGH
ncbi:MAG: hypothetical protein WB297_11365 [Actinomycetota bacterium]